MGWGGKGRGSGGGGGYHHSGGSGGGSPSWLYASIDYEHEQRISAEEENAKQEWEQSQKAQFQELAKTVRDSVSTSLGMPIVPAAPANTAVALAAPRSTPWSILTRLGEAMQLGMGPSSSAGHSAGISPRSPNCAFFLRSLDQPRRRSGANRSMSCTRRRSGARRDRSRDRRRDRSRSRSWRRSRRSLSPRTRDRRSRRKGGDDRFPTQPRRTQRLQSAPAPPGPAPSRPTPGSFTTVVRCLRAAGGAGDESKNFGDRIKKEVALAIKEDVDYSVFPEDTQEWCEALANKVTLRDIQAVLQTNGIAVGSLKTKSKPIFKLLKFTDGVEQFS